MPQLTVELPVTITEALTAYIETEQQSSSETIQTVLESFLIAKGYLSPPKKSFYLAPAIPGSGYVDTALNHDAVLAELSLSHSLPSSES